MYNGRWMGGDGWFLATTSFTSAADCQTFLLQAVKSAFPTKMSSETTTCPGCDHLFSLRGYQHHLALTKDPLCRAIFDKLKKANDAYELLMSAGGQSSSGAGPDTDAMPFQGNAFGTAEDYASDLFRQDNRVQPDDLPPLMEVSDDEDDNKEDDDEEDNKEDSELANMVAELEKSWDHIERGPPIRKRFKRVIQVHSVVSIHLRGRREYTSVEEE
ncbi:uncharacterized protein LACBIDRAFT_329280 [Laccaria bicolor S238N-H82]|uniref:Predicted protein n=1 Tax=Laccaria bicolor (strain S238N-H82 / ATCC MYA-4686) TaxID=486041 RepID=B0DH26_LACBS|nr:uncharacterized protein LACBIDRAFT_329280 [Laccaria bicolor S238N-H82]EDR06120.1 predicted protein [Laccaria bicolor S238N-H82]|eukprot:XP_001883408.1 predicted protein [Laccaria bicolor S238N-H82]